MKIRTLSQLILIALIPTFSHAVFIDHSDEADFLTSISGTLNTIDFDGMTSGDFISSGDVIDGVTFDYDLGDFSIMVSDAYDTTSATNFIGTDDGTDAFLGGDGFTLTFDSAISSFGIYMHSADEIFDDDIWIETNTGGLVNLSASEDIELADGGFAYFIGLSTDQLSEAFTEITLSSIQEDFAFNIDDLMYAGESIAVDEPSAIILLTLGIVGIFYRRKKS